MKKKYLFFMLIFLLSNNLFSQGNKNSTVLNSKVSIDSSIEKKSNQENAGNALFKIEVGADHQVTVSNLEGQVVARHTPSASTGNAVKVNSAKSLTELQLPVQNLSLQKLNPSTNKIGEFSAAEKASFVQHNSTAKLQKQDSYPSNEQSSSSLLGSPNLGFYTGIGSENSFEYNESTHVFDVVFCVANFGTAAAGSFRVGCYVSTDTLITTSDYKTGSSMNIGSGLASNKIIGISA